MPGPYPLTGLSRSGKSALSGEEERAGSKPSAGEAAPSSLERRCGRRWNRGVVRGCTCGWYPWRQSPRDVRESCNPRMGAAPRADGHNTMLALLTRRKFVVRMGAALGALSFPALGRARGQATQYVWKLRPAGHTTCRACVNHDAHKLFAYRKAANGNRAHVGCNCRIVR